jgi:glutathione S-transferase
VHVQAPKYRVQAARKLISNRGPVTRFCLRAVGSATPGKRFSAPLAEPDTTPDMTFYVPMDVALRCTAMALLEGTNAAEAEFGTGGWLGEEGAGRAENVVAVQAGLQYLRDRVGVPRDLQLPAARQLRAHLNWTLSLVARL